MLLTRAIMSWNMKCCVWQGALLSCSDGPVGSFLFAFISVRSRPCSGCCVALIRAADSRRVVRHTFWKRLRCMAFLPEVGLDLSALPGANRGADLDMIRCRRAGLAEVRLLA